MQHKFLRYLSFKAHVSHLDWSYGTLESYFNIFPIQLRRLHFCLKLLHKILNGQISSNYLIDTFVSYFHEPIRFTRNNIIFYLPNMRTNYMVNSPIFRIMSVANLYCSLDDFYTPFSDFLRNLPTQINT